MAEPTSWQSKALTWVTLASAVGALVGFFMSTVGMRIVGPEQGIAAVRADVLRVDTAHVRRIEALEAQERGLKEQVSALQKDGEFQSYLSCVILRRIDQAAVPPRCSTITVRGTP